MTYRYRNTGSRQMKPFEASGAWLQKASKKNDEKKMHFFFFPPRLQRLHKIRCMLTLRVRNPYKKSTFFLSKSRFLRGQLEAGFFRHPSHTIHNNYRNSIYKNTVWCFLCVGPLWANNFFNLIPIVNYLKSY